MPKNHKPKKPIKDLKLDISDEMIAERRGGSGKMPQDMPKWMASTITKIDLFNKWVGNTVCWITIPLILAMTYEVLARKLFNAPTMWAYDMSPTACASSSMTAATTCSGVWWRPV